MTDDAPDYPPPMSRPAGRTQTIVGFVLAAGALVFIPIIFGPAGAAFGVAGMRKGDPLGRWAIIASVATTVVGVILVMLFADTNDEALALGR